MRLLLFVLLSLPVAAQSFYSFPPSNRYPSSGFYVCGVPANGNPCTNQVAIFTTNALTTKVSQPAFTGPDGNFGFWLGVGQNQITIQVVGQAPFIANIEVSTALQSNVSTMNVFGDSIGVTSGINTWQSWWNLILNSQNPAVAVGTNVATPGSRIYQTGFIPSALTYTPTSSAGAMVLGASNELVDVPTFTSNITSGLMYLYTLLGLFPSQIKTVLASQITTTGTCGFAYSVAANPTLTIGTAPATGCTLQVWYQY